MDQVSTVPVPSSWTDVLDESEADLSAGRIVPGDTVMADLLAGLARLEASQADKERQAAKQP